MPICAQHEYNYIICSCIHAGHEQAIFNWNNSTKTHKKNLGGISRYELKSLQNHYIELANGAVTRSDAVKRGSVLMSITDEDGFAHEQMLETSIHLEDL